MARRWLLVWAACYGLTLIAGGGALYLLRAALPAELRAGYADMLAAGATLLTLAAIFTFVFTGMLAYGITRAYFAPVRRHAELIRLIAGSNPDYRIDAESGLPAELRELSRAINQLADRNQHNLHEVESRIQEANTHLAHERSQLAALLSDLAQSVVVCNAEGRVLLYNEQARRQLRGPAAPGFLGLGRSLYELIDGATIAREYASLRDRLAQGEPRPVSEFSIARAQGESLQARMAPVKQESDAGSSRAMSEGYVLLLTENRASAASSVADPDNAGDAAPLAGRPVYYDFDLFHQPGQTQEIDDRPLRELAYTVFDTETTGLNPGGGDEIISIGAIRIVNGRLLPNEIYQQLVDPRRKMHADSIRVHGITPDLLAGRPLIDDVLPAFHRFCADTVLVGHNAAFDMRFLELKAASSGVRFTAPVLDTLLLSAALHGDRLEHHLEAIAARLGVSAVDRHTALGDAITTARVFLKLTELLAARGITTLRQAREASAQTLHARIRY
jgi:DNA polymerase III subunit epsilon